MIRKHDRFLVTNKIAIYSHDLKTVMVMNYRNGLIYGLPGGHLDAGEIPEAAMARELVEELGTKLDVIEKRDFYIRDLNEPKATVVLAYTAVAPEGFTTSPTNPDKEHGIWLTPEEVPTINMADSYKKFVLENWPKTA